MLFFLPFPVMHWRCDQLITHLKRNYKEVNRPGALITLNFLVNSTFEERSLCNFPSTGIIKQGWKIDFVIESQVYVLSLISVQPSPSHSRMTY
jgi:hypothetical protein